MHVVVIESGEALDELFLEVLFVEKMTCRILAMLAEGLNIHPSNAFSKLLMDEKSDCVFRLNHYPSCTEVEGFSGKIFIVFGEHTDPQIISVLRSNNTSGLQSLLNNGHLISVPPDQNSFFINVGDLLQVMSNGKFKKCSIVLTNSVKPRLHLQAHPAHDKFINKKIEMFEEMSLVCGNDRARDDCAKSFDDISF